MTDAVKVVLILFASVALVAGCSSEDDAAEGMTVITILIAPDAGGGWQAIKEAFEKRYSNIRVELKEGPTSTDERENMYTTSFMAEDGVYDLIYMDIIWVPKFASRGWLEMLDGKFRRSQRSKFLPGDIAGSTYAGRIYRVPMQSDAGMLYYRKDLLEKAGIKPPRTFAGLLEACRKLNDPPNLWGFVFQGKQYEGLVCCFLEVLWGHGGEVLDPQGRLTLDSPKAVAALSWLVRMVQGEKLCPQGVTTYEEEESRHIFQQGRAAFMRNWPYAWNKTQDPFSAVRGKVGIKPMVHARGAASAATLGGWGLGISKFSTKKEAAWKFIDFATSPDMQKLFHMKKGAIPTRRSLFEDKDILAQSPHYTDLYNILLKARPRPVHPRYAEISDIMQRHVSSALVGMEKPEEAIRRMVLEIRARVTRD